MRLKYSLFVLALYALACSQQISTSPSELTRTTDPSTSATSSLTSFELNIEEPGGPVSCARSPGFWCQNQDGENPNLTPENWEAYLTGAVALLTDEGVVTDENEVAGAVCDVGRQLFRHLAALALNLAAGFVDPTEPLTGEDAALGTVGEAFSQGAMAYNEGDALSFEERQAVKDVLDRINNNVNLANDCALEEEKEEEIEGDNGKGEGENGDNGDKGDKGDNGDTSSECPIDPDGKITICHVPPGNPDASHTIRIDAAAWPAHKGHGDYCGPCN
jgi:hypothetical protein